MAKKITLGKIDYLSAVNHLLKMIFYSLNCNKDLHVSNHIFIFHFFSKNRLKICCGFAIKLKFGNRLIGGLLGKKVYKKHLVDS